MWSLRVLSKDLQTRPSDLLAIRNPLVRYYFDHAVWLFGSAVEADLEEAGRKAKNERLATARRLMAMNRWVPSKDGKGIFRDPASRTPGKGFGTN